MSGGNPGVDLAASKTRIVVSRSALGRGRGSASVLVDVVDEVVCGLGRAAGWDRRGRALVALGGYGRREFAPWSDVDLLFLTGRGADLGDVDSVLYPLWDLGFDVGHALRTPTDCAELCLSDVTAATAFLDSRLLLGDRDLHEKARRKAGIRAGGSREMRRWVRKIADDVAHRRARFGEISHLLEPHVKEGRGGLRDLQACRWVLACLGRDPEGTMRSLPGGTEALRAGEYLGRTRNALHIAAGRKTDHLTFEFHEEVATVVLPESPIDEFFASLHRASHRIIAAWEDVVASAEQTMRPPRQRPRISVPPPSRERIAQELLSSCRDGGDLSDELRHTLIDGDRATVSAAVQSAVARVLRSRIPLAPLLHQLYRVGALDLIAPELESVAHQVHYDVRHAFTTGIHCIETLGVFEDLWLGMYESEEPHLTRIAGALPNPAVVRIACLCHDLGKVRGTTGHAEAGASIARDVALRLGLDPAEAEEAAALVAQHRVVPDLAFGEDLEDCGSWEAARRAAGSSAALDALVALAFSDLRATNPGSWAGLWSDWKRDLLLTLHARAQRPEAADFARIQRIRKAVREAAARIGPHPLDVRWDRIPRRQALQVPPDLLAQLLALAADLEERPAGWRVERRGERMVEILGVVQPLPRVLSSVAGTLTNRGFDILSFQAHTWADGITHLWVRAAHRQTPPIDLAESLTRSVTGAAPPKPEASSSLPNPRDEAIPVSARVRLLPDESPFYSVLEVRCRDRRGLIRDLTRSFEDLGLTVEYALVTTHGPMAQDIFHLKDIFGGRVEGTDKLRALLRRVEEVAGRRPQPFDIHRTGTA